MYRLLLFILAIQLLSCQESEKADIILHNGLIRTMQSQESRFSAMAIKGERILYVGSDEGAMAHKGTSTQVVDLEGRLVLPGFTDAHVHPLSAGLARMGCDLSDNMDPDSVLHKIADYAAANPDKEWIRADNFWLPLFDNGNPKKEILDAIVPDRPVYVTSADGHNAWVNSKALELAGITAETPDPAHGRIERDSRTNAPTGTLRESAMELVSRLLPEASAADRKKALLNSLQLANSLGITNLVEASASPEFVETYLELSQAGQLSAHVSVSVYADVSQGAAGAKAAIATINQYKQAERWKNDLRLDQVKLFMDGVVEGKTAALLHPYADDHHEGIANATPEAAKACIAALDKAGLQIHVHGIGDRGIRMTLDAIEAAQASNGARDARYHIAHLHLIHPDDLPRFGALGVWANFQALWATLEDTYMTEMNFPFLGEARIEWQYPIGSVHRAGGKLAFGSDWDVSTMNPFEAMQVAVTRRGPDSIAREPWTPQHLVDVPTVVEGYTQGGAYLTFLEHEAGTLEVGKLADLIVLDQDIFSISKWQLHQTKVLMTLFRGKIVFQDSAM